jgi:hypothetical protein
MAPHSNGERKSITLKVVEAAPEGSPVFAIQGGPFVAEKGADTNYVCGKCAAIIASMPGNVKLASDTGAPVVLVCYSCGAKNLAP